MTTTQVVEGSNNTGVATEVKVTKADVAREVFKRMYGTEGVARKNIIAALIAEAKLTKAGAATYYQNMVAKRKAGKL